MCGLVCPSRISEREGKGYSVKGGLREGEERVKERVRRSVNPIPNPDSDRPKTSSANVAERGVASIGVRSSGNLCVDGEYVWGEAGAHSTTPTYTAGGKRTRELLRESCEGAELVGVLGAETIHPACMCEGGGRGGERVGRTFYYTVNCVCAYTCTYSGQRASCEGAELVGVLVADDSRNHPSVRNRTVAPSTECGRCADQKPSASSPCYISAIHVGHTYSFLSLLSLSKDWTVPDGVL
jgi:hypothetical protein